MCRPSHICDKTISTFYLENPRSRSLVRSKLQHGSNILSIQIQFFHVNSSSHNYDTVFIQNLTLKIQGQGHAEGHIVGTTPYIPFFWCLWTSHSYIKRFKDLSVKIRGQGHGLGDLWKSKHGSNILSNHITFRDMGSAKTGPSAA